MARYSYDRLVPLFLSASFALPDSIKRGRNPRPRAAVTLPASVNQMSDGRRLWEDSQVGIRDARFTQSLLVQVNARRRRVCDGIQHHRDLWRPKMRIVSATRSL